MREAWEFHFVSAWEGSLGVSLCECMGGEPGNEATPDLSSDLTGFGNNTLFKIWHEAVDQNQS